MKAKLFLFFGIILTGLVMTSGVNAQTTQRKMVELTWSVYLPCVPETAVGKINLHVIINYDKYGFIAKSQSQPQGGELIGDQTGYSYRPTGVSQFTTKVPGDNGSNINNYTSFYHFVGQKGIQYRVRVVYHLTINSNGEITAVVDKSETDCR